MPAFRTGFEQAKAAANPFAHLSLDERRQLCLDVLDEVGAQNVSERGHELYHSCLLPWGNHANGDRNPSASVNYEKMVGGCYVCGGGGWLWWIAAVRGLESSGEARDWVMAKAGPEHLDTLSDLFAYLDSLEASVAEIVTPPPVYDPQVLTKWMKIHPYMTEHRHIPMETMIANMIGYGVINVRIGDNEWVDSHRIVIPHFFEGKLYGWQSRRLNASDGTPKYLSTPDMPKDSTLFNFRKDPGDCVIVESPMTVLRHAHHASLMATFGAAVTDKQMDVMLRTGAKRVILWFDNDTAGWNATETVGEELMKRTVVYAVQCPYEGDPADLDDEAFDEVLTTCVVPFALWVRPKELMMIGATNGDAQVRNRESVDG